MDSLEQFRQLSTADKVKEGEDGLAAHLLERANYARFKYGGLSPANFGTFLEDRECVRYPTRLLFEFGEMGMHQFAHPNPDPRDPENSCVLYLRPSLAQRPDLVALAIAYMMPVLNYGEIVTDDHCLIYGAVLQGLEEEEFYRKICELADFVGAENLMAGETEGSIKNSHPVSLSNGNGCGSGCGCH